MASANSKNISGGIFGDITKELREFWAKKQSRQRLASANDSNDNNAEDTIADETEIRKLFHDVKLYPSKSQVYEMVHCAREGDHSQYLTFGEFCIYATELKRQYEHAASPTASISMATANTAAGSSDRGHPRLVAALSAPPLGAANAAGKKKKSTNGCSYDVFLGGSCNPTTWRRDIAIPHFKSHGITFYNPQQSNWVPEMIELEHQAKQTSEVLFFVVNEKTRNVVSMIEISYLAGKRRKLVCVLAKYPRHGHKICNEDVSEAEWSDLNSAVTMVHDLVERQGIPIFSSMEVALDCATKIIKEGVAPEDLSTQDGANPVKHADLQIGDSLVRLREAFDSLDTAKTGRISLADLRMAFRIHVHRELSSTDLRKITNSIPSLSKDGVSFDNFCCIVAEFKQKAKLRDSRTTSASDGGDKDLDNHSGRSSIESNPHQNSNGGQPKHLQSKRRRVRNFFARVFKHSSCSSSASSVVGIAAPNPPTNNDIDTVLRDSRSPQLSDLARRGSSVRDVYLGGSTSAPSASSWREEVAVPVLKKHGLTYFNATAPRTKRLMPMLASAMDNSRVLLFVILDTSRSVAAMTEAAFHIGRGHNVVLCIQKIEADASVYSDAGVEDSDEVLSKQALKDFNRGRAYLSDIANREGVPVFDHIAEALDCVVQKCKGLS